MPSRPYAASTAATVAAPTPFRRALAWAGTVITIGLLFFFYHFLSPLAEGVSPEELGPSWLAGARDPFISEMTGSLGCGLLFFPILWLVRALPLEAPHRLRRVPYYLIALSLFAVLHTFFMWGSREAIHLALGLGHYDYGLMPLRFFMELPMQVIIFTLMVAGIHGVRRLKKARESELRAARLESGLAQAQLRNLRLQLQPHFLFNALHSISATMYEDPEAADEMLDRLAELLRLSLRTAQSDEVPLATELETLDGYLQIMRARFGDQLKVTTEVDSGAVELQVPSLLLQPLVENAIRHGRAAREGCGRIDLRIRRSGDRLSIQIENDGSARASPTTERGGEGGLGLSSTVERLRLLYGEEQSFEARSLPGGGFLVSVLIPLRGGPEVAA